MKPHLGYVRRPSCRLGFFKMLNAIRASAKGVQLNCIRVLSPLSFLRCSLLDLVQIYLEASHKVHACGFFFERPLPCHRDVSAQTRFGPCASCKKYLDSYLLCWESPFLAAVQEREPRSRVPVFRPIPDAALTSNNNTLEARFRFNSPC